MLSYKAEKYCTLSYGINFCREYGPTINQSIQDITVLTNFTTLFSNKPTKFYSRNEFSYYEKIILLLKLVKEYKQRVTYFDVDSYNLVDFDYVYDNNSVYTYKIYDNSKYKNTKRELIEQYPGVLALYDIYNKYGYELCKYPHERIISIPYSDKINNVLEEIQDLQDPFEVSYPKGKVWKDKDLTLFAKNGCGYGEGGALAAVLHKHNIKLQVFYNENKFL